MAFYVLKIKKLFSSKIFHLMFLGFGVMLFAIFSILFRAQLQLALISLNKV